MKRSPLYVFNNQTSTGIYDVPLESIIQVINSDGAGTPSMTQIINKAAFHSGTTIQQYLATPTAYKDLDKYLDYLSELKDVTLPAVIKDGSVLQYNGTEWVSSTIKDFAGDINLGDLKDITPATLTDDGKYLEWNSNVDKFIYVTPVKEIDQLANVDAPNPVADQILNWNDTSNTWVAVDLDGGQF